MTDPVLWPFMAIAIVAAFLLGTLWGSWRESAALETVTKHVHELEAMLASPALYEDEKRLICPRCRFSWKPEPKTPDSSHSSSGLSLPGS